MTLVQDLSTTNNNNTTNTTTTSPTEGSIWDKYFQSLRDNLNGNYMKEITEIAKNESYALVSTDDTSKPLKRRKISIKQFKELEDLRAKFAKEDDREKATDLLAEVYMKCCEYYFGVTQEEYENTSWDDTKKMVDAAVLVSTYGRPK